jgi:hypothetical protein
MNKIDSAAPAVANVASQAERESPGESFAANFAAILKAAELIETADQMKPAESVLPVSERTAPALALVALPFCGTGLFGRPERETALGKSAQVPTQPAPEAKLFNRSSSAPDVAKRFSFASITLASLKTGEPADQMGAELPTPSPPAQQENVRNNTASSTVRSPTALRTEETSHGAAAIRSKPLRPAAEPRQSSSVFVALRMMEGELGVYVRPGRLNSDERARLREAMSSLLGEFGADDAPVVLDEMWGAPNG